MFGKLFGKKTDDLADEIQKEAGVDEGAESVFELQDEGPGWMERLSGGLTKTRGGWVNGISRLFSGGIDENKLEEFEEMLIQGDLGVKVTMDFMDQLTEAYESGELKDAKGVRDLLKKAVEKEMGDSLSPMSTNEKPFSVVLMVGINGVGKTTTTAKLANLFQSMGKKVLLVAGDTFRAGAVEQLKTWGSRLGCEVICGKEGADPASVAFEGIQKAHELGVDLVLVDTAGRLHTQDNLMEEIKKVNRVIKRQCPGAPHETLMVIDATTGQNALNQARSFHQAIELSGLVMTKLDGTARGGSLIGIHRELNLPVRFIGVGEKVKDLHSFDPQEFTGALFD